MAHHEEVADLMAENAKFRAVLESYAELYCEGWCKENGGQFDDCGGCAARNAIERSPPSSNE